MALTPVAVADVPVQQPRRAAGAAADAGRVRAHPGRWRRPAAGWLALRRRPRRVRLPDQDAAGAARRARRSRSCTWSPPRRTLRRRLLHLLGAGAARWSSPAAGGWRSSSWCPTSWRPYIGGSQTNSVWELILGYNGLGRLTGDETGSVGGGGGGGWGATGIGRLFTADIGGQVAWLLPGRPGAAASPGWSRVGRAPRTDPRRAALLLWGGWLVVTGAGVQPDGRASSTPTTRSPWPRRSRRWSASAARLLWQRRAPRLGAARAGRDAGAAPSLWAWVLLARSARLLPVAEVAGAGRRPGRRRRAAGRRPGRPRGGGGAGRGRPARRARRAGRVRRGHGGDGAHRVDPERRARRSPAAASAAPVAAGRAPRRHAAVRAGRPARPTARRARGAERAGGALPGATPGGTTARPGARRRWLGGIGGLLDAAERERRASPRRSPRTRRPTPGWPRPSGPTAPPATSWPPELPVMPIGGFNGSDPSPDARAVPAVRGRRPGALVHRRRGRHAQRQRQQLRAGRSPAWVEAELHAQATTRDVYDLTMLRPRPATASGWDQMARRHVAVSRILR